MPKNPLRLKAAYLYPDILKSFCDRANLEVFSKRAQQRDIKVEISEIKINDKINSAKFDFYYIGGSNTENLKVAYRYLKQNKEDLKIASLSSVPILGINCGYALLGNSFQLLNSASHQALNILDIETSLTKNVFYSKIIGTCELLENKNIVGFQNHNLSAILKDNVKPFLILKKGHANNEKDKTEGAVFKNTIGSFITSPLLAQNPHFCDFLISRALTVKYKYEIPLASIYDDIEWFSHNYLLESK